MKLFTPLVLLLLLACSQLPKQSTSKIETVCNPMDLSYRFRPETHEISRREAADPTLIKFKDEYYLFASKSGGYWTSTDLIDWEFILTNEIPTEDYAPTTIVLGDTIYMSVSSKRNKKVYKTTNPKSGKWEIADSLEHPVEDPAFYLDDDGKLYLFWGCSNVKPLYGAEIDMHTFDFISETQELIHQNPTEYGWEVRGDNNTEYENPPWLEGLWMNKHRGTYYLQYSAPGTREKSYADGVYISKSPLGPYELAQHNPFSYKPEGYACGAGHGSTFEDKYGNLWHVGTISISVKHIFERRIGFYPAAFDNDGVLYTTTKYGDYPIIIPNKRVENFEDIFPEWMLLSYQKEVSVSSTLDSFNAENMVDENIRTYWAAKSGSNSEWASIDLGAESDVYALQINFAEHNTNLYGRTNNLRHQYVIESSNDNISWMMMVDKSENNTDNSHNYIQLDQKETCRYLRVRNSNVPGGNFALSGFRVFGKGYGDKPKAINSLTAKRKEDQRAVELSWSKSENATGYMISYGETKEKLYHNYMVYEDTTVVIRSLNSNSEYFFTIESFNENGITKSNIISTTE